MVDLLPEHYDPESDFRHGEFLHLSKELWLRQFSVCRLGIGDYLLYLPPDRLVLPPLVHEPHVQVPRIYQHRLHRTVLWIRIEYE